MIIKMKYVYPAEGKCCVCLEEFKTEACVETECCKQAIHEDCIGKWSGYCPLCCGIWNKDVIPTGIHFDEEEPQWFLGPRIEYSSDEEDEGRAPRPSNPTPRRRDTTLRRIRERTIRNTTRMIRRDAGERYLDSSRRTTERTHSFRGEETHWTTTYREAFKNPIRHTR